MAGDRENESADIIRTVFAGPAAATDQTHFPAHLPRDNEMRSYQKDLALCCESY